MTRTIEEIRLDVLRLAVTSRPEDEALDWAATAMLLIEHGPTPVEQDKPRSQPAPRETVAQAIKAGKEDVFVPGPAPQPARLTGRPPQIDEATAREMFDAGATFDAIGARFGVQAAAAQKLAALRGWPKRRPRTPAAPERTTPPAQGYRMAPGVPVPAGPGAGTPITRVVPA